jgi:hypothetical protein
MSSDKKQLFNFLDERAFKPVLDADPDDYSGDKRKKLEDVQRATRSERKRYENYGSGQELYRMFEDDLNSEPAQQIHRELKDLGLPTLNDIRGEFEKKAKAAGVTS